MKSEIDSTTLEAEEGSLSQALAPENLHSTHSDQQVSEVGPYTFRAIPDQALQLTNSHQDNSVSIHAAESSAPDIIITYNQISLSDKEKKAKKYLTCAKFASIGNMLFDMLHFVYFPFLVFFILYNILGFYSCIKLKLKLGILYVVCLCLIVIFKVSVISIVREPEIRSFFSLITVANVFVIWSFAIFLNHLRNLSELEMRNLKSYFLIESIC